MLIDYHIGEAEGESEGHVNQREYGARTVSHKLWMLMAYSPLPTILGWHTVSLIWELDPKNHKTHNPPHGINASCSIRVTESLHP